MKTPFPTKLKWEYNEISSSNTGRTLGASMNKKIVATKRKLVCNWEGLDDNKSSKLLKTIKAKTYGRLKYPDAFEGDDVIKTFYTGDASAEAICIDNDNYKWNVSFDFIEK